MPNREHNGITYEYMSPLGELTPDNRLGFLRFSTIAGRSALLYARAGGVKPEIGRWVTRTSGERQWELQVPQEAKIVFDGFARVLDVGKIGDVELSDEARQRVYTLSLEIRNGISQAASYHPAEAALTDLKQDMTRSLEGLLVGL